MKNLFKLKTRYKIHLQVDQQSFLSLKYKLTLFSQIETCGWNIPQNWNLRVKCVGNLSQSLQLKPWALNDPDTQRRTNLIEKKHKRNIPIYVIALQCHALWLSHFMKTGYHCPHMSIFFTGIHQACHELSRSCCAQWSCQDSGSSYGLLSILAWSW